MCVALFFSVFFFPFFLFVLFGGFGRSSGNLVKGVGPEANEQTQTLTASQAQHPAPLIYTGDADWFGDIPMRLGQCRSGDWRRWIVWR